MLTKIPVKMLSSGLNYKDVTKDLLKIQNVTKSWLKKIFLCFPDCIKKVSLKNSQLLEKDISTIIAPELLC